MQADIKKGLPYNNDKFDVIYSKSFVEHFYHPEKLISEMHRVLKPSGIIIALTLAWKYVYKMFFDNWTHFSPSTKVSLQNILKMHNFQEVKSEYFYQLPIVWKNPWLKPVSQFIGLVTRHDPWETILSFFGFRIGSCYWPRRSSLQLKHLTYNHENIMDPIVIMQGRLSSPSDGKVQ